MAALWPQSLVPQIDANGDPMVGAQAFFYDASTLTPQTTYSDSALSEPSTHDDDGAVVSDANGRFPAVFLNPTPGSYRCRVLDSDGVVIFDIDGISVPQDADFVPPSAGDTDTTLLFSTGDILARHGTGAHPGFVRAAGRTIGSATSGATERANADTEDLFLHLYDADTTLSVSGGRGANAAADWAANKTIALPDYRGRALVGLADMGNSSSSVLSGVTIDNSETVTTLGATLGAGTVTLDATMIPSHTHTATFAGDALAPHSHTYKTSNVGGGGIAQQAFESGATDRGTSSVSAGTPSGTVTNANTGGGLAHSNTQPSALVTIYIKL